MILSHRHRFIFLKINKTASTSMEIALSKHCGPEDVITPILAEDEGIRKALGYRRPQNYLASVRDYDLRAVAELFQRRRRKLRFYNHMSAREVRERVEEGVWNGYYKFCFERNPWDRVISFYYFRHPSEPRPTLSEFVRSEEPLLLKRFGSEIYTINGAIAVDKIYRYEDLGNELDALRRHLGLSEALELPRAKARYRQDSRDYRDVLGETERRRIADLFSDEIARLGYAF